MIGKRVDVVECQEPRVCGDQSQMVDEGRRRFRETMRGTAALKRLEVFFEAVEGFGAGANLVHKAGRFGAGFFLQFQR